jgi:hypothetical protein
MVFLLFALVLILIGQTMAVFDYEFTVGLGLQEHVSEVTPIGVEVNRGFGAGDTVIYIPLILLSMAGLYLRKRWALYAAAAVMGISSYWATTVAFMYAFLLDVPEYPFVPTADYWISISVFIVSGILGLLYLVFRGETLLEGSPPTQPDFRNSIGSNS